MSTRQAVTRDPELGPMRWCRKCQEWWPDDGEFWQITGLIGQRMTFKGVEYRRRHEVKSCRACRQSTPIAKVRREDRKLPPRPYSNARPCAICLTVLTTSRMCHGCSGRIAGPLTAAKLAEWGLGGVVR